MLPSFITFTRIVCHATDDITGADDLYAVIAGQSISLGRFSAGDDVSPYIEATIPEGVTRMTLMESDFPDSDDVLATVDLEHDMDVDRVIGILEGSARYDIWFRVLSGGDDVDRSNRCGSACPTCGGGCLKDQNHGGTAHWCGRHEWGAN
ncbi:hypothetical protein [Pseudoxanthomonas beigongshangi]